MATTYTPLLELPKHDPADPFDITKINEGFDKTDAAMAKAYQGKAAHSILDNGWFVEPVNQRGITTTTAAGYNIDRWSKGNASGIFTAGDGYVSLTGNGAYYFFRQYIPPKKVISGQTYTFAFCDINGDVVVFPVVLSEGMSLATKSVHFPTAGITCNINVNWDSNAYDLYLTGNSTSELKLVWAACYPGSYTADTLPEYQPKENELAECQLYHLPLNHQLLGSGYTFNGGAALLIPHKMRIYAPSFVASGAILARANGRDYTLTLSSVSTHGSMIKVDFTCADIPVNYPCAFYASAAGVSLNADM